MASQKQAPDRFDISYINDEKLMDEAVGMGEEYLSCPDYESQHWNKAKVSGNLVKKLFGDPLLAHMIICLKILIN